LQCALDFYADFSYDTKDILTYGGILVKRFLLVLCVGLFIGTAGLYAQHPGGTGIGVVGGGGRAGSNVGLSLKVESMPPFWGINLRMNKNYFGLGVSGDYYLVDKPLVPNINLGWFFGIGGYVNMAFYDDTYTDRMWLGIGARIPIGLSWQPAKFFEIFAGLVPDIGLGIVPELGNFVWNVNGELGVRVWL
jgi:hypothetical protein